MTGLVCTQSKTEADAEAIAQSLDKICVSLLFFFERNCEYQNLSFREAGQMLTALPVVQVAQEL
ncbi:hypothetical protein BDD14_3720 [Edaphobacter modestus]|uniref:Uncharacterized protein n=1 Tax=Edaphobacter modestus TaxID=388466 RepID=A0A4Q7YYB7_9BACT|nr:hypothetical protein BDD14_3720 [Edaphobacter modestus]